MFYVGKTINTLHRRLYEHKWNADAGTKLPVYEEVRRLGSDNIRAIILDRSDDPDTLVEKEIWWIGEFRRYAPLTNQTAGGDAFLGWKSTPEHRKALSKATRGIPNTPEQNAKIAAKMKGNTRCVGRVYSEETINKMRKSQHIRFHVNLGKTKAGCEFC